MSPQWIVSAAHCFSFGSDPKDYAITAGKLCIAIAQVASQLLFRENEFNLL